MKQAKNIHLGNALVAVMAVFAMAFGAASCGSNSGTGTGTGASTGTGIAMTCPANTTGTYPNCVAMTCPAGQTGTYPNCVAVSTGTGTGTAIACPANTTGTYPNCVAMTCPANTTGTYPNCVTMTCPAGQTGAYPICSTPPPVITTGGYTDNGNGTVTQSATGLVWQQQYNATLRNWATAGTYCAGLSLGGVSSGWRLPTKDELVGIVDNLYHPAINPIFKFTEGSAYWSSTTVTYEEYISHRMQTDAGIVSFHDGSVYYDGTTGSHYVRCVRLGP